MNSEEKWIKQLEEFELHHINELRTSEECGWTEISRETKTEEQKEKTDKLSEVEELYALNLNFVPKELGTTEPSSPPPPFASTYWKAKFWIANIPDWFSNIPETFHRMKQVFGLCKQSLISRDAISMKIAENFDQVHSGSDIFNSVKRLIQRKMEFLDLKQPKTQPLSTPDPPRSKKNLGGAGGGDGKGETIGNEESLENGISKFKKWLGSTNHQDLFSPLFAKRETSTASLFERFLGKANGLHFAWLEELPKATATLFRSIQQHLQPESQNLVLMKLIQNSDPLGLVLLSTDFGQETILSMFEDATKLDRDVVEYVLTNFHALGVLFVFSCFQNKQFLTQDDFLSAIKLLEPVEKQIHDPALTISKSSILEFSKSTQSTTLPTPTPPEVDLGGVGGEGMGRSDCRSGADGEQEQDDNMLTKEPSLTSTSLIGSDVWGFFFAVHTGLLEGHLWSSLHPLEIKLIRSLAKRVIPAYPDYEKQEKSFRAYSVWEIQKLLAAKISDLRAKEEHYWRSHVLHSRSRIWWHRWVSSPTLLTLSPTPQPPEVFSHLGGEGEGEEVKESGRVSEKGKGACCGKQRQSRSGASEESLSSGFHAFTRTEAWQSDRFLNPECFFRQCHIDERKHLEEILGRKFVVRQFPVPVLVVPKSNQDSLKLPLTGFQVLGKTYEQANNPHLGGEGGIKNRKRGAAKLASQIETWFVATKRNRETLIRDSSKQEIPTNYYSYGSVWILTSLILDGILIVAMYVLIFFIKNKIKFQRVQKMIQVNEKQTLKEVQDHPKNFGLPWYANVVELK